MGVTIKRERCVGVEGGGGQMHNGNYGKCLASWINDMKDKYLKNKHKHTHTHTQYIQTQGHTQTHTQSHAYTCKWSGFLKIIYQKLIYWQYKN